MIFLALLGSSVFSQTASLPTTTASPGDQVILPITVTNWTEIGAITLNIQIDPAILAFQTITGYPSGMLAGVVGNTLTLSWSNTTHYTQANGVLANLVFMYTGPGTSALTFLPSCSIIQMPGFVPVTVAYTAGLVSPFLGNTTKATLMNQTCAVTGGSVSVPIQFEGFGNTVGSITQKVQFDNTKMTFVGVTKTGSLVSASAGAVGNIVTIAWENSSGANINYPANQFILNFTYTGTSATTLLFYPGCLITTNTTANIPVSYFNGTVGYVPAFVVGSVAASQTICSGTAPAGLTSTAPTGGSGGYTYQWQTSVPAGSWSNISGATLATYAPGALTTTTLYRQTQTNTGCGFTANTNSVTISLYPALVAGTVGAAQSLCSGSTPAALTTTTAPSGGSGVYEVQWQTSLPAGSWSDIAGATLSTYSPGALTTTTMYRKEVYDVTCDNILNTNEVTITIYGPLVPGAVAASQTICSGVTPAGLTTTTSPTGGSGVYTLQWQSSLPAGSWSNISGATLATYSPGALTTTDQWGELAWLREVLDHCEKNDE